jgi:hypothetical protein
MSSPDNDKRLNRQLMPNPTIVDDLSKSKDRCDPEQGDEQNGPQDEPAHVSKDG